MACGTLNRERDMIYVVATASVKADKREEFMAGARICIAETVKEAGCVLYDLHASVMDPTRFVFVEKWETREALTAHSKSDHLKAWRKVAGECSAAPTKIEIIHADKVEMF
jgi:quinol monooxygenase YgiN